jgi:hypothetical protein
MDNRNKSPYWPVLPSALALSGIILFVFATYGPPASSSGFVTALNGLFMETAPEYARSKAHYAALPGPGSWLMAFVLGMAGGGFLGGLTSKIPVRNVPEHWEKRFGPSRAKRYAATFAAGFLILFASRLAGGCTLGMFISNSVQLGVSGLYFGVTIFGAAVITARVVYGKGAGRGTL